MASRRSALCAAIIAAAAGCGAATETAPDLERIVITPVSVTLATGNSAVMFARLIEPNGQEGDASTIEWSSDDPGVAYRSAEGIVRGVGRGSTLIVAAHGAVRAVARVTVSADNAASLKVSGAREVLWVDDTLTLTARVLFGNYQALPTPTLLWISSRPDIVEVSALGRVRGVAPGMSTIQASANGLVGTLTITVTATGELHIEGAQEITPGWEAQASLRGARGQSYVGLTQWSSSDTNIVVVSSAGVMQALRPGVATLHGEAAGQARELRVTVRSLAGRIGVARDGALALMSLDEAHSVTIPQRAGGPFSWPHMALSPNGREVAYDCGASICREPIDASKPPDVLIVKAQFPTWTADGNHIAARTDYAELGMVDVATGALTRIRAFRYVDRPHVAPDGQSIAYDCDYSNPYDSLDDTCVSTLKGSTSGTILINYGTGMVWSPDGAHVAWQRFDGVCVGAVATLPECTNAFPATADDITVPTEIAWSPDGKHLLITHGRELLLTDADGGNRTRQSAPRYQFTSPSWITTP